MRRQGADGLKAPFPRPPPVGKREEEVQLAISHPFLLIACRFLCPQLFFLLLHSSYLLAS